MFRIDINNPVHVHFIGIGGISMSGLAVLLAGKGFTISGSDRSKSEITKMLEENGIRVFIGQGAENIDDGIELVVYTAAIHPDNPEYAECVRRGLPMMDRATLLGQLCGFYKTSIGVAGTHGKTTPTSMLSLILMEADTDPTISVGGILPAIGGNLRIGGGDEFLFEACEDTNSFLKFNPTDEIILNIEADHLDFFKDINDIRHSFSEYADIPGSLGHIVINGEIKNSAEIVKNAKARVITYGPYNENEGHFLLPYDYNFGNVSYDENGYATFTVYDSKIAPVLKDIKLSVPGAHNVSNATAAIALAKALDIPDDAIRRGLEACTGAERRFQKKGEICGVTIIDDYAHHPTEISATLATAKKLGRPIWCVFQPHTYSRTKALRKEFVEALSAADKVVLAPIYAARETDDGTISSDDLCEDLRERGVEAYAPGNFDEIENFLLKNCVNQDLLITMGAGDVVKIGEHLLGN